MVGGGDDLSAHLNTELSPVGEGSDMINTISVRRHNGITVLGRLLGCLNPPFASMRRKVNCAMFVQARIGYQLSHLYWKTRVDSTQMMVRITVTIKATVGIIILR